MDPRSSSNRRRTPPFESESTRSILIPSAYNFKAGPGENIINMDIIKVDDKPNEMDLSWFKTQSKPNGKPEKTTKKTKPRDVSNQN